MRRYFKAPATRCGIEARYFPVVRAKAPVTMRQWLARHDATAQSRNARGEA